MDTHTPLLTVVDSRQLVVRKVAYHRRPGSDDTREDVSGIGFDLAGRISELWDARLWAKAQAEPQTLPNRTHLYSLSGVPLLSASVDEGWDLSLLRECGVVEQSWETKGASWTVDYDELLRPIAKHEIAPDQSSRMMSRCVYADSSEDSAARNQCGQLIELYDGAGLTRSLQFSITGQCLSESRQFLRDTQPPDWAKTPALETQHTTLSTFSALGEPLTQTGASGHRRRFAYDVAGANQSVWLALKDQTETRLLHDVKYNAQGQVVSETAGNGVISISFYDPITDQLQSMEAHSGTALLQKLEYTYDPVGNVTQITDGAQPTSFFRNQQVPATNTYRYDSLYQLIEATGRESVDSTDSHRPPEDAAPNPGDTSQLLNYSETYQYDPAGNMLELRHVRDGNNYTRSFTVSETSNRSLLTSADQPAPGFDTAFDEAGNLLLLQPGQTLQWGLRNQLSRIATATRAEADNDEEVYVYDGDDQRVRKLRTFQTQGTVRKDNVIYLPGLEIRTSGTDDKIDEHLEVITIQAGRSSVRCLHWVSGKPEGVAQNQVRYSLGDHLGSSTLELDAEAKLLSHEGYLPFGGTAWWAANSVIEGKYKTIRYSGKERDASGLYYYGYRYYAPWLQRWINPDPGGEIDGLNLYVMVHDNPVSFIDPDGRRTLEDIMGDIYDIHHLIATTGGTPSEASQMGLKNLRKELLPLLQAEICIHLAVIETLDVAMNTMLQQYNNQFSAGDRLKGLGKRVGATAISTGVSAATGAALGAIAGPVGSVAGAALGAGVGLATKSIITDPLLEKLDIGRPIHLRTSPLKTTTVWDNARKNNALNTKLAGKVADTVDSYNPKTFKGITTLTTKAAGKLLSKAAGEVGAQLVTTVDIFDDYSSSMAGKTPFKIDQMITELETHIELLNSNVNRLAPAISEFEASFPEGVEFTQRMVHKRIYTIDKLTRKTNAATARIRNHIDIMKL